MLPPPRPGNWLLRKPTGEAPARLFCFPYSGLGASMYNRWPDRIGPAEVCRVQLPGRENRTREPHYGTYEQLAEQAADALTPYLDRPFGFFGHCGGVLPAFATALALHRRGAPAPDVLFLSSQVAPQDGPFGRYLSLSSAELAVELANFVRKLGGQPHPDLIEMGLDVLRADLNANRAYRIEKPEVLPGAVHSIGWDADQEIRPEQMAGWAAWADPGACQEVVLAGDHHTFLRAPQPLLDVLDSGLSASIVTGTSR